MKPKINFSDIRPLFRPIGPLFAVIIPWCLVMLGQWVELCKIIVPTYSNFYLIVIANCLTAIVFAFYLQSFFPKPLALKQKKIEFNGWFKGVVYGALILFFLFEAFQMVYCKGFPLLWLVLHVKKTYMDFGIHSLNGLVNALYLFATTGFLIIYQKERKKRQLLFIFCLLTVPIMLISRQLLMSLFLQLACVSMIASKRMLRWFVVMGLFLLTVFVFLGNLRTGITTLVHILGPIDLIPQFFYPLLWIYAYLVTPFNNINASFDYITPLYEPYYELRSLLPSIFRNSLGLEGGHTGYLLVHDNMTVSTFYLEPLLDFGPFWAFTFMAFFQIMFLLSYRKACITQNALHVIEYSVLYMIAILSIFSNLLLYLPVVAQLLFLQLAKWQLRKKNNLWILQKC